MKKILGIITALNFAILPVPMVISCQTKQENSSVEKIALEKLINKVDKSINNQENQKDSYGFKELNKTLEKAKEISLASGTKEKDYINHFDFLQESYGAWQAGSSIKTDLKKLIQTAQETLISTEEAKLEDLTRKLMSSIEEAIKIFEVRSIDIEAFHLAAVRNILKYNLDEFKIGHRHSYLNLNYAINILAYQSPLNKLVI